MNIIYPPLVEQAYQFAKNQGLHITKDEVYRMQVEQGLITETGEPTQKALNEGLVTSYQQKHKRLIDFKQEYPIFAKYPAIEFTQQAGIWYVSQQVLSDIIDEVNANRFGFDGEQQLLAYFNFRNYDDPHGSIAEMKGVFHPWYTQYDDSLFQIVDGNVGIPLSVLKDLARRADNGEIDLDAEALYRTIDSYSENG